MAKVLFNKKALGSIIISENEKGELNEILDRELTLEAFDVVENKADGTTMVPVCFQEIEGKYFWASTSFEEFLIDNAEFAQGNDGYLSFPENVVKVTYKGQVPMKRNPKQSCNVWVIDAD